MSQYVLPAGWVSALSFQGIKAAIIDDLVARAYADRSETWPTESAVFRAFELTPIAKVRVVVVGQDPYPSSTNATGVAFSTGHRGAVTDALRAIYTNLGSDPSFVAPKHGDLTEWTDRGALLLNAALTLGPTSLDRRCNLWRPLLRATLEALSATNRPIPVILLGGKAFDLRTSVSDPAAILGTGHPTPRNKMVKRFPLFENIRPFHDANRFLLSRGEPSFDWSVP
jgi:uracil-DNA glycosylase